jgi:ATP-binding protein involved in chromosome partitioning
MSTFQCPDCGGSHDIFGSGGGHELAEDVQLPFLGEIPLDPSIREGGDDGEPMVLGESDTSNKLDEFAQTTADMQGIIHRRQKSGR